MAKAERLVWRAWQRFARPDEEIVPGTALGESVDIDRLICPLRYDICVRIEFLRLLRDEWSLYHEDPGAFRQRPPARDYYRWFRDVRCARYEPRVLRSPAALEAAFLRRMHQTAGLWRSVERGGLDPSRPIRLITGRSIQRVNGKTIQAACFPGDGCHRIACHHLAGQKRLGPAHYEIQVRSTLRPIDNTAILIDSLPLSRPAYLRYLSRFYCDGAPLESPDALVRHVASRKPELLPELTSVLASDLPRVRAHG